MKLQLQSLLQKGFVFFSFLLRRSALCSACILLIPPVLFRFCFVRVSSFLQFPASFLFVLLSLIFCFMILARSCIHPACPSCSLMLLILPTCAAIVSSRPAAVLSASSSLLRPNIVVNLALLVLCPALAIMCSRPAICIALLQSSGVAALCHSSPPSDIYSSKTAVA